MPSRQHHPFYPRIANYWPAATGYGWEVACLFNQHLAVVQLIAYGGDVVNDVLAAGFIALHEVGGLGEWDELISFP